MGSTSTTRSRSRPTRLAHARFPNNVAFVKLLLARLATQKSWVEWKSSRAEYSLTDPRSVPASCVGSRSREAPARLRPRAGARRGRACRGSDVVVRLRGLRRRLRPVALQIRRSRPRACGWRESSTLGRARLRRAARRSPALVRRAGSRSLRAVGRRVRSSRGGIPDRPSLPHARRGCARPRRRPEGRGQASGADSPRASRATRPDISRRRPSSGTTTSSTMRRASSRHCAPRPAIARSTPSGWAPSTTESAIGIARSPSTCVRSTRPGERDGAAGRLAELATRQGFPARIESAYQAERKAAPDDWQMTLGYADFLRALDRTEEAVALLNREVVARHDVVFIGEA